MRSSSFSVAATSLNISHAFFAVIRSKSSLRGVIISPPISTEPGETMNRLSPSA